MLSLSAGAALAQTAPTTSTPAAASSDQLQEVVITAQFRTEDVQQAPLAISAINGASLADRGQTSITQITQDVPSVQLAPNTTAFGPSMSAYIRGIGQGDNDPALEPGVGIYIDDVYFGTTVGSVLDLLDLDRVEVLRGPQGTLEGMNSEGGAIKLFSKAPDATDSSSFDALYGSREHVEIRASSNFALSDNLFVRLSGVANHQDGYEHIVDFGCANPSFAGTDIYGNQGTFQVTPGLLTKATSCQTGTEGGIGYDGGRASIRWVINDHLDATLTGDITDEDQENPAETLIKAQEPVAGNSVNLPATNVATGASTFLPYNSALIPAMIPTNPYNTYTTLCLPALAPQTVSSPAGSYTLPAEPAMCGQNRTQLNSWGTALTVNWTINDNLSLKNILSDRGYSSQWYEDNDASPWPLGLGADGIGHHQFSEELRLNGTSLNKLLDWTIGGFYFGEQSVYASLQDLWYATGPGTLDFIQDDPITAHDRAGYLHTVWHLLPKLDVTLAGRYTSQDKDYHYVRVAPESVLGPGANDNSAAAVAPLNGLDGHYAANRFDYRGDIAYHFTEQFLLYGQVSTGFKGGGVDPRPFYVQQAIAFKPETLTNYELGIKTSWLDNRLHVNLDGYFSQYDNIQLALLDCSFIPGIGVANGYPCALPYNVGNAHEKGVELESQLRLGGFQFDLSASYLDFDYTYLQYADLGPPACAPGVTSCSVSGVTYGMVTPFTPKLSGNAGVQYTFPIPQGAITARVDGTTRTDVYTNAVNGPLNRIGGYTVYNAHLIWDSPKGNWQIALQALNMTNKFYWVNLFDLSAAGGGSTTGTPSPPRELDIELKHKM